MAPTPASRFHSRHERWNLQTAAGDDLFGSAHSVGERVQPSVRATLRRGVQGSPTRPRRSTGPRPGDSPWRRSRCGAAARGTAQHRAGRVGYSGGRARRAGETDRAIVGYRKVLSRCPTCWEALEALCSLGEPPDVETLLPASTPTMRPRSPPRESVPVASVGADHLPSASQTGPQPLTPSQNVVVNAPVDYVHATRLRGETYGPGLVTPIEVSLKPSGGVGWEVKGKGRDAAGAPPPLRRVNPGQYVGSRSTNEQDEYVDQQSQCLFSRPC